MGRQKGSKNRSRDALKLRIVAEDFVRLWRDSESLDDVMAAMPGWTRVELQHAGYNYRRKGIPMKMMPRRRGGIKTLDVERLTKIANGDEP